MTITKEQYNKIDPKHRPVIICTCKECDDLIYNLNGEEKYEDLSHGVCSNCSSNIRPWDICGLEFNASETAYHDELPHVKHFEEQIKQCLEWNKKLNNGVKGLLWFVLGNKEGKNLTYMKIPVNYKTKTVLLQDTGEFVFSGIVPSIKNKMNSLIDLVKVLRESKYERHSDKCPVFLMQ